MTSKDPAFTEAVDDLNAAMAGAYWRYTLAALFLSPFCPVLAYYAWYTP